MLARRVQCRVLYRGRLQRRVRDRGGIGTRDGRTEGTGTSTREWATEGRLRMEHRIDNVGHRGPLVEYEGTYGGPNSREEILRVLKEALALVYNTAPDATLACSGLRIEVLHAGTSHDEA